MYRAHGANKDTDLDSRIGLCPNFKLCASQLSLVTASMLDFRGPGYEHLRADNTKLRVHLRKRRICNNQHHICNNPSNRGRKSHREHGNWSSSSSSIQGLVTDCHWLLALVYYISPPSKERIFVNFALMVLDSERGLKADQTRPQTTLYRRKHVSLYIPKKLSLYI